MEQITSSRSFCRHISACSSVVMEPHNSLITSEKSARRLTSYSLSRFSTCDEGVYFMYMTEGHGEKRPRYTRQKGSFITIQSLACFKANVKNILTIWNKLPPVGHSAGIFPPLSSVVMEPHNPSSQAKICSPTDLV